MRAGLRTSVYQSYVVFALLFSKNLKKPRYNIYGNLLPVFSNEVSRLEEKKCLQLQYFNRSILLQRKPLY